MDIRTHYVNLIKEILLADAAIPVSIGDYQVQPIFDEERGHYLQMVYGIDEGIWEHHCIAHLELRDGKIYFWWDGFEYSVAQELYDRGVPDKDMVLAYQGVETGIKQEENYQEVDYKSEKQLAGVS